MTKKCVKISGSGIRHVSLYNFAIVLVPMVIFVMEAIISDHLMTGDVVVPTETLNPDVPWLEAAGRSRFLAATWFFASVAVLAACLLIRSLARPLTSMTRWASAAVWLFIVLLALSPTINIALGADRLPIYRGIGTELYETALSNASLPGCENPNGTWLLGRCGDLPAITLLNRIIDVINLLAGVSVGALIVGMILCLNRGESTDVEEEAAVLAENFRHMRQQLYLSSVVLTFGTLFATSWMYWPMPMVSGEARGAYGTLVQSAALFTGTYFTLLILSFYLPVAILLDGRARDLAQRVNRSKSGRDPQDANTWLASRGLKEGLGDYLKTGFALAAPILTAFAGGIAPVGL